MTRRLKHKKRTDCVTLIQSPGTGKLVNDDRSQNTDYPGEGRRWEMTWGGLWALECSICWSGWWLHVCDGVMCVCVCMCVKIHQRHLRIVHILGPWVAQSVKCPTLDFSSGHDVTVCEFEPRVRLQANSVKPAWDSLSLSLSAPPPLMLALSLKISK